VNIRIKEKTLTKFAWVAIIISFVFYLTACGQTHSEKEIDWVRLLDAIYEVEHPKNRQAAERAYKREGAIGPYQIRSICARDINRIMKTNHEHEDFENYTLSRWAFLSYTKHYGRAYEKRTGLKATAEVYARMWNGGPRGYEKTATEKYWKKVRKSYD
jgi:hypothetical protein